ncbi:glycosyltransferase family 2 protein [Phaeobacter sp. HF9A]|uniref:glycosyltransferase family 2 protein n=1 Tax=Phaeobacter sp. HF9A TaxID=2721561 RepID=UPI001431BC4D|nr:glycosyltransferase family 2 protein [Phaeobacter sp. HF9A]NIZ14010.1 glycosyltransferase family 2 protein [Phaeobacter sp. HF9A]
MIQSDFAVVTIVRDDLYFLKRFIAYYGGLFGRRNLYIISHGDEDAVRELAEGCTIFPIPAIETSKFTMLHWRTKNHLKNALRQWYRHVIVCDVDEFIVVDPASGMNLRSWLETAPVRTVYSAMGMEVLHMRDRESDSIEEGILGPRRHVRVDLHYAKPCILSRNAHLARGGHYSEYDRLNLPEFLYLFHMKYCDFDLFVDTLNRRNAMIEAQKAVAGGEQVRTNPAWFAENRRDEETFAAFEAAPVEAVFDLSPIRAAMHKSWRPRKNNLWHFDRPDYPQVYHLPERFIGADQA